MGPLEWYTQYHFQHEDLIRKREKIQQQTSALEAITLRRTKSILDARRRLDRQRDKYQNLKQMEDQKSAKLLSTMIALVREKENAAILGNAIAVDTMDHKKGPPDNHGLDEFQEAIEKRQEEALMQEMKISIDYAMLPNIISQKADALKLENEIMQAEIARLEATLHAMQNED